MKPRPLLQRLAGGAFQNVSFRDFRGLVESYGFTLDRINGSHHIFTHAQIPELVNLQEVRGEVKPYQIRQFLRLIERYNLRMEDEA
ncbi:MAG: type II toxin-antitoxin system HicA family toxin [Acidobacteriota bacterium]